jgi:periplasmic mercuric ion binding protein
MRNMKKGLLLIVTVMLMQMVNAQEKKSSLEIVIIQTSAECGDCKERIEETLNYTKGVKFSELDLETMKLTVKYSPKKISLQQIKEKIVSVGYDADELKADAEALEKLPACCKPGGMKHH